MAMGGRISVKKSSSDENEYLTEFQKKLIRETWPFFDKDLAAIGMKVFLKLFDEWPDATELYPFGNITETDDEERHGLFRAHAGRFMRAVEVTVQNLDNLDAILTHLVSLGRSHAQIPMFNPDYLGLFRRCMTDVWSKELGKRFTKEIRLAWSRLFLLITMKIDSGYVEVKKDEYQQNNAHTDTNDNIEEQEEYVVTKQNDKVCNNNMECYGN